MKYGKQALWTALQIYAVTDRTWAGEKTLFMQVNEALTGGATMIQLREKDLEEEVFLQEAVEIKQLAEQFQVPFIINDHVPLAIKCGADGVHIGQDDMGASEARTLIGADKILGVSVSTVDEAIRAEEASADYLGVGAIFSTSTKLDAKTVSYDELKKICNAVTIPVVAIGGITVENIRQLYGSGIQGVALVSAIFGAEDIQKATCQFANLVKPFQSIKKE